MDKIEIVNSLIQSGIAKPNEIEGFTELEVEQCEQAIGFHLPHQYREFLLSVGHKAGLLFQGTDVLFQNVEGLLELRKAADDLLNENEEDFNLPSDAFVYSMHQGYEFNYFIVSEGNNPPVYQYVEGDGPPVLVWDSFSTFLKKSINSCAQSIKEGIIPL
ncbi:SMI1/KNR4 family protein [Paenibacillus mesophilus]|uniref:SMI1/KNR4 family protein n=1 Tax=Paenibacillus mesophilus TaxID=2582849 RepID=UPI00110DBA88|nr:SMI1/KNR4 family protein [Paenibacillus mesophilus]TMV50639.1 SMI1/KNR4 family protein [Paenibacillus mesophilus]